jgi:hypothetical protein
MIGGARGRGGAIMSSLSFRFLRQAAVAGAAVLLASSAWAADALAAAAPADPTAAVWAPRQLHFVFLGFTAHYSCDGLQDKIRHVLMELGAQPGFEVTLAGCSSPLGRPDPFPGVNIKMNVLQPADPADLSVQPVAAHWRRVDLHLDKDPVWEASDCELLEQIKQQIVPLFSTRDVQFTSNCVPHQAYLGTRLSADFLVPDKDVKAASR